MLFSKVALVALATVALGLPARASDWYVDAQNGSDASDGLSSATAWKTLTHALAAIPEMPLVAHTVHVAPGTYNPALGEVYPLFMRPRLRFVGEQGSASTILEGAGANLLTFASSVSGRGYAFDAASGADGLTLRLSGAGIDVASNWNPVSPSFHDLVIQDMSDHGVSVGTFGFGSHSAHPTFDHVTVKGCSRGFDLEASGSSMGSFGSTGIDLTDCRVENNSSYGIYLLAGHGSTQGNLERCRITGNGVGVLSTAGMYSLVTLIAHASLIATNLDSGVRGTGFDLSSASFQLTDCTIARNATVGFAPLVGQNVSQSTTLSNCVLFGNGDDLVPMGSISASFSDSGDGDLLGYPSCIAADPLFANAAIGDYRLRFGSPCIDAGNPASNGALDLLGHARPYDGNLDTIAAVDMGAFEFEPLHRIGTPALGQQFGFEFWGATGSMSSLLLSKQPLTPAQSTPFGDLFLAPGTVIPLGILPAQPGPPFVLRRTMPNNPALIGTTFSFQALTDSAVAPQGQAYTNPTSFVVLP